MSRSSKKVNLMESIDVDKILIQRDIFLTGAYVIQLPLDSQPDYVWQTLFEQEWKSSLHLWERKVVVVGDKVLLITTPNEIAEKIDWLRKMIESTNMRVERLMLAQEVKEEAETTELLAKHENIIRDEIRIKLGIA
ncbi:MAG: hypothetical protein JSV57_05245 [Candidatus Bathyarchaeota archaeon]|nr:MAG: hypothetical protein JSV57_05245 [Candidatus Bathyarchaeota archaeon]